MILYFLPAIIFLGIITIYEDIKFCKIRNKWIIWSLVYAVLANMVLFINNRNFSVQTLTNMSFSIIVGFGFWYYNVWTAGDGKLFIAYSALLPIETYQIGYENYFPAVILLFNIIIISFIIFLLEKIIVGIKYKKMKELLQIYRKINLKSMVYSFLFIFSVSWVVNLIFLVLGYNADNIIKGLITVTILIVSQKYLKQRFLFAWTIFAMARLIYDSSIYSVESIFSLVTAFITWKFFNIFVQAISARPSTNEKKFKGSIWQKDMVPFAPFMLIGTLITILANGNILIVILSIFHL